MEICMEFLLIVMGNKQYMQNPHIRAKCLIFFSILIPTEEQGGNLNKLKEFRFDDIWWDNKLFKEFAMYYLI